MKRNENKKSLTKKIVAGTGLALLLALVGYTGANTYAKYTTTQTATTQTATVAKWGVVVNVTTANIGFKDQYDVTSAETGLEVKANTTTLAPGTSGQFTFSIAGTPEVSNEVSFNFVVNNDVHDGSYYPVKWTITDEDSNVIADNVSLAEAASALNAVKLYNAATADISKTYTVAWAWAFSQGHDTEDTALGNYAAGNPTDIPSTASITVDFSISVTIQQTQHHGQPNA